MNSEVRKWHFGPLRQRVAVSHVLVHTLPRRIQTLPLVVELRDQLDGVLLYS